jgi:hypothetical protein
MHYIPIATSNIKTNPKILISWQLMTGKKEIPISEKYETYLRK